MADIIDTRRLWRMMQLDVNNINVQDLMVRYIGQSIQRTTTMKDMLEIRNYDRLGQEARHLETSASALGLVEIGPICEYIITQCELSPTIHRHRDIEDRIRLLEGANRRAQTWVLTYLSHR
ncbi:hypothetical protein PGT21_011600 [Puccinia graminis f. sp. tritici]|uniref:HPt domain-containing protein n=2 Tax=Puccinia graminis f. sp. tritici TaxID=56615 RepID=E3KFN2_PUCGT|nr:uncharacterized protein PGTG_09049 [Puccinia graminis f. sp. tritici CRL 75-36-700-3]EFP83096.2 hypothetical protein PGTG_09049 [Puccinia graminis f. sp. tritici CRL 75-36-700-3]KAA1092699.1 hypothetical protein PGT21_011600 [Puccinia graminis f. sp. tritici]KAA1093798.1 hypothetical protein PGTUg99_030044 [Puccinia graminis f. sp. tritici]